MKRNVRNKRKQKKGVMIKKVIIFIITYSSAIGSMFIWLVRHGMIA